VKKWEYNTMARSTVDWDDDDDFEADEPRGNEVPDLRKAYNALKRQYKELESKYTETQKGLRERSVKDVLAAKGLSPKIAALIPESITSQEEVDAWVDNYADVFGTPAPAADDATQDDTSADAAALGRINSAQSAGQSMSGSPDQMAALIAAASSPDELNRLLFGNASGPQAV